MPIWRVKQIIDASTEYLNIFTLKSKTRKASLNFSNIYTS